MKEPRIHNIRLSLLVAFAFALFVICYLSFVQPGNAADISASGVTAQTVIDRVRYDLNEETAAFWSDTELIQWMNEAIWEINSKTRCLERSVIDQALAEDDYDYTFATAHLDIELILHDSGTTTGDADEEAARRRLQALERRSLTDMGHTRETGRPKFYATWNDILYVWPIPDSDQSGTTLHIFCVSQPTGITSATSAIETPAYFDHCIPNYIKAKAYYKDKRDAKGNYFMALFEKQLREYVVNVINRHPPQ